MRYFMKFFNRINPLLLSIRFRLTLWFVFILAIHLNWLQRHVVLHANSGITGGNINSPGIKT